MHAELFAGIPVRDYAASLRWYERLLGKPPAFFPDDTEAVWEVGERRFLYIDVRPAHAGHAMLTLLVDDLDALLAELAERGLTPAAEEAYPGGVRKAVFRDPDGNEIGLGGGPS